MDFGKHLKKHFYKNEGMMDLKFKCEPWNTFSNK